MANFPLRQFQRDAIPQHFIFEHMTFINGLFKDHISHLLFETKVPPRLRQHTLRSFSLQEIILVY